MLLAAAFKTFLIINSLCSIVDAAFTRVRVRGRAGVCSGVWVFKYLLALALT